MSKTSIDFSEKRREKRFPINSEVKITLKPGDKVIIGKCINISGSGLLLATGKPIAAGKTILIEIAEGKIEYSAEATVVRCDGQDEQFQIGIQVTNQIK